MSESPKMIDCIVTKQKSPALDCLPYPGELGEKIYKQVSQEGWNAWLNQLTMLINDYGLRTCDISAQNLIKEKMEEFFFSDKSTKNFTPPKNATTK